MTQPSHRAGLKRLARVAGTLLVIAAVAAQFIRSERPRGELPGDGHMNKLVVVPGSVDSLLRRSCYDCHSDDTRWPWYAQIAPVSWLITQDVRHGRSNLDFSRWSVNAALEPTPQQRFQWMCRDVRREIMPPRIYLVAHPHARLTATDKKVLCAWADQRVASAQGRDGFETPKAR